MKQNPEGTGPKSISLERKMQRKKLSDSYHFALIIHQTLADHFPKFVVKKFLHFFNLKKTAKPLASTPKTAQKATCQCILPYAVILVK